MTQKNGQNKRKLESDEADTPIDPQSEWERRMREIFTEPAKAKSEPMQAPAPMEPTAKNINTTKQNSPQNKHITSKTRKEQNNKTSISSTNKHVHTAASNLKIDDTIAAGDITRNRGYIDDVLEEFTMEKAVIYSEILKPKFEE